MKTILIFLLLLKTAFTFASSDQKFVSAYFKRPLNCPLRFSNFSELRDQIQSLTSSLGNVCSQNGQQALNQLRTSVANLEGIANTFSAIQGSDQRAQNIQLARNANQVLGSLNIITSNNACFYDIRTRGALPVISDIVMSVSQIGLLVPTTSGAMVATGGYIAGSGMKIINELIKKKFNWNRPEERRAFLQLNCAFFDNRKVMEEMGIFNPETKAFREQLLFDLKKERALLLQNQRKLEASVLNFDDQLNAEIEGIPGAKEAGVSYKLKTRLEELIANIGSRPSDYPSKWKQVSHLAIVAPLLEKELEQLSVGPRDAEFVRLMRKNLSTLIPELETDGRAWTSTIDEYEMRFRGPVIAFASHVLNSVTKKLLELEAEATAQSKELASKISELKVSFKEARSLAWATGQRLVSVEMKIESLETFEKGTLFSQDDQGKSDAVEILDYYRKLQRSILGKEGMGYLKSSLARIEDMKQGLDRQIYWFDQAKTMSEKCAAAEKLRFAWTEFRFKVQESHDFVVTNMDLYRASFRIGKEKQRRAAAYVLNQIRSVEELDHVFLELEKKSLGSYMRDVKNRMSEVEDKLATSGCF